MRERESFGNLVKIIISTFKEDAEKILVHMRDLIQLLEPLFKCANRGINQDGTSNADEDEVECIKKA